MLIFFAYWMFRFHQQQTIIREIFNERLAILLRLNNNGTTQSMTYSQHSTMSIAFHYMKLQLNVLYRVSNVLSAVLCMAICCAATCTHWLQFIVIGATVLHTYMLKHDPCLHSCIIYVEWKRMNVRLLASMTTSHSVWACICSQRCLF
jgi:hypothetical protein